MAREDHMHMVGFCTHPGMVQARRQLVEELKKELLPLIPEEERKLFIEAAILDRDGGLAAGDWEGESAADKLGRVMTGEQKEDTWQGWWGEQWKELLGVRGDPQEVHNALLKCQRLLVREGVGMWIHR